MKKLSPEAMIEAYWLRRLQDGTEYDDFDRETVEVFLQLIVEGLVAYDPETDMLRWSGPVDKRGRPLDPRA